MSPASGIILRNFSLFLQMSFLVKESGEVSHEPMMFVLLFISHFLKIFVLFFVDYAIFFDVLCVFLTL